MTLFEHVTLLFCMPSSYWVSKMCWHILKSLFLHTAHPLALPLSSLPTSWNSPCCIFMSMSCSSLCVLMAKEQKGGLCRLTASSKPELQPCQLAKHWEDSKSHGHVADSWRGGLWELGCWAGSNVKLDLWVLRLKDRRCNLAAWSCNIVLCVFAYVTEVHVIRELSEMFMVTTDNYIWLAREFSVD